MLKIKKILSPTDSSACAEHAFSKAAYLAYRYEADLHVLHVTEPSLEQLTIDITEADIATDLHLPFSGSTPSFNLRGDVPDALIGLLLHLSHDEHEPSGAMRPPGHSRRLQRRRLLPAARPGRHVRPRHLCIDFLRLHRPGPRPKPLMLTGKVRHHGPWKEPFQPHPPLLLQGSKRLFIVWHRVVIQRTQRQQQGQTPREVEPLYRQGPREGLQRRRHLVLSTISHPRKTRPASST